MDTSYTFVGAKNFTVTNSRESAIDLAKRGYTICLIPQMFESDNGIYGGYMEDGAKSLTHSAAVCTLEQLERDFIASRIQTDKPDHPLNTN